MRHFDDDDDDHDDDHDDHDDDDYGADQYHGPLPGGDTRASS